MNETHGEHLHASRAHDLASRNMVNTCTARPRRAPVVQPVPPRSEYNSLDHFSFRFCRHVQRVARFAPAGDGDQGDLPAAVATPVAMAAIALLREGGFCLFSTPGPLERDDEDLIIRLDHHVDRAMAGGFVAANLDTDGPQTHVQEARIPRLMARHP